MSDQTTTTPKTFEDLPDSVIRNVFVHLDLPSRLKMRLNRRLNDIQRDVPNSVQEILTSANSNGVALTVICDVAKKGDWGEKYHKEGLASWEDCLNRLALNTSVQHVYLNFDKPIVADVARNIAAVSSFEAERMYVFSPYYILYQMSIAHMLEIATHYKYVEVNGMARALRPQDICAIRTTMRNGCKMRELSVKMSVVDSYLANALGVTVEEKMDRSRIFRGTNTVIYSPDSNSSDLTIIHVLDNIMTTIERFRAMPRIIIRECDAWEVPHQVHIIQFNTLYRWR